FLAGDAPFLTKRYGRHGPFRGLLSALEALVRPHVAPVSVAPAVGDSQIIEVAVDGLEGAGPLQVEDYICIFQQPRTAEHNLIFLQNQTHAAQVPNDRLDPVLRSTRQRLVFVGEIDFRLNAAPSLGNVVTAKHVRESQKGKANVLIVNVGQLRLGEVVAVYSDIHQHAGRAGQTPRRVTHILGRALDHPN